MTFTLPDAQRAFIEQRVKIGRFASASEVVRAGLRALEREETEFDDWMRAKIRASLDDPRPDIPSDVVAERLRAKMSARSKGG